jgi:hypothetical protein
MVVVVVDWWIGSGRERMLGEEGDDFHGAGLWQREMWRTH